MDSRILNIPYNVLALPILYIKSILDSLVIFFYTNMRNPIHSTNCTYSCRSRMPWMGHDFHLSRYRMARQGLYYAGTQSGAALCVKAIR